VKPWRQGISGGRGAHKRGERQPQVLISSRHCRVHSIIDHSSALECQGWLFDAPMVEPGTESPTAEITRDEKSTGCGILIDRQRDFTNPQHLFQAPRSAWSGLPDKTCPTQEKQPFHQAPQIPSPRQGGIGILLQGLGPVLRNARIRRRTGPASNQCHRWVTRQLCSVPQAGFFIEPVNSPEILQITRKFFLGMNGSRGRGLLRTS